MQRILLVANDLPYPPNHGAAIDMWGHIQSLKQLDYVVDLVVTTNQMPSATSLEAIGKDVDQLFLVERQRGWISAAGAEPFQVRSRAGLATVPLSREYAAVILMAEHVAPILQNQSLHAKKRILRLHNNETRFFWELAKSSKGAFHKLFCLSEAIKFKTLSPRVMAECDALWFISDYEYRDHVRRSPSDSKKSFLVPPYVNVKGMRSQPLKGQKVIFIGTLALANNASGVEWYVSNVHSSLSDVKDYEFVVAGNTRGTSNQLLRRIVNSHQNICLHENPENIQHLYCDATVFVNPVFRGAGLKMKTIDAIQAGLPIVTTSIGIEGTGLIHGKHLLVADTPGEFAECIRRMFNDKTMARELVLSAQEYIAREFDQRRIIEASLSALM
jgi:glycosyltransferase involved in cell wall biosynthesis